MYIINRKLWIIASIAACALAVATPAINPSLWVWTLVWLLVLGFVVFTSPEPRKDRNKDVP